MLRFHLLPLALISFATAACSVTSTSTDGSGSPSDTPPGTNPGAPPGTPGAPPATTTAPGAVDPSCGADGYLALDHSSVSSLLADGTGALLTNANGLARIDGNGALSKAVASGSVGQLAKGPNGTYYGIGGTQVVRFGADLKKDPSFTMDPKTFPAQYATFAVASDGSVFVAGAVNQNTSQEHVVVRHYLASGAIDGAFTPVDDQMPKDMSARELAVTPDGALLIRSDKGFSPALIKVTKTGALDTSFGDAGVLVLDAFGPRDSRALHVDAQGKILMLGMDNLDIQVQQLLPNGTPDTSFGNGGMATVKIDVPESTGSGSGYTNLEARAMLVDDTGRIVITVDEMINKDGDVYASAGGLYLVRLDASGKLDPSFGTSGISKIALGADATLSSNLGGDEGIAMLGNGRLLLAGQKGVTAPTGGLTMTYAVACVKM